MAKLESESSGLRSSDGGGQTSKFDVKGLYEEFRIQKPVVNADMSITRSADELHMTNIFKDSKESSTAKASCGKDCDWRPDEGSSSEKTRKWREDARAQRQKQVDTDEKGEYKVKPGDTIWDISKRLATPKDGPPPSIADIQKKMDELLQENKGHHRNLDCNPHLLRPGDTLKVPGEPKSGTASGDASQPQELNEIANAKPQELNGIANAKPQEQPNGLTNAKPEETNGITNIPPIDQTGGESPSLFFQSFKTEPDNWITGPYVIERPLLVEPPVCKIDKDNSDDKGKNSKPYFQLL